MKNKKTIIIASIILLSLIALLIFVPKMLSDDPEVSKTNSIYHKDKELLKIGDHIVQGQYEIDKEIKKAIDSEEYTMGLPKIMVNPYKQSPYTALIIFETKRNEEIEVYINGKLETTMKSSKEHVIPIYGLMPGNNDVELKYDDESVKHTIMTKEFNKVDIEVLKKSTTDDIYLFSGVNGQGQFAYDGEGNVRWSTKLMNSQDVELLSNGHLLVSKGVVYGGESMTGFYEIDYFGKVYNDIDLEKGFRFDVQELRSGNLMILTSNPNNNHIGDYIIELDLVEEKQVRAIDLYSSIKRIDKEFAKTLKPDWAQASSIYVEEEKNQIIVYLRGNNSILSLNTKDQQINWIIAEEGTYSEKFDEYILKPIGNTRIPKGAHSLKIEENKLTLINNDFDRNILEEKGPKLSNFKDNYSTANEYSINLKNNTVEETWSYNQNIFSTFTSSLVKNEENILINYGWAFNEIAYKKDINITEYLKQDYANIIELDKEERKIFEAKLFEAQYSVQKVKFYKEKTKNYEIKEAQFITNKKDDSEEIELSSIEKKLNSAEEIFTSFSISRNRLNVNYLFEETDTITLYLISEDNKVYKQDVPPMSPDNFCIKLDGKYAIYIGINNKIYKTNNIGIY